MKDMKMTKGQMAVLAIAATPMVAVGVAGAVATYVNMNNVLHRGASALGLVAAGEGATLICALVALAVTLMGQHTPPVVRFGMWVVPLIASGAGVALAPNATEMVVMGLTPLAMTAAGEGITFVARRVVAYRTGVDIEQQRQSGLLLWHARRAAGDGWRAKASERAVWRLTRSFASTDGQMSVQLNEIQRFRIGEGADQYLSAVLTNGSVRPAVAPAEVPQALPPADPGESVHGPLMAFGPATANGDFNPVQAAETYPMSLPQVPHITESLAEFKGEPVGTDDEDGYDWIQDIMDEAKDRIPPKPVVELMTSDDVAIQLNRKPATVRSWVARGKLRVHERDVQGRSLFHPDDVANLS